MILVDSHCHLDMLGSIEEIKSIVLRANESGVKYMQTICTRLDNFDNILSIANQFDNVYASFGIHPCEVTDKINYEELICHTINKKVIGIGETGLDYYHDISKVNLQKQNFIEHIKLSHHTMLPIIIHTRNADVDTIDIVVSEMRNAQFTGLIHCFTASKQLAYKMLDNGLYISISGIVSFSKAQELQEIVKALPLDRILIETDSPYLAPDPMRGKKNEPSFVKFVMNKIAELKAISPQLVAETTTKNFFDLFTKAQQN